MTISSAKCAGKVTYNRVLLITTAVMAILMGGYFHWRDVPPRIAIEIREEPVETFSGARALRKPLEVKGALVGTEAEARKTAEIAYIRRMQGGGQAGADYPRLFELGYDVNDLGKCGDAIWEVRIREMDRNSVEGIIWVHPRSGQVRYVVGRWDMDAMLQSLPTELVPLKVLGVTDSATPLRISEGKTQTSEQAVEKVLEACLELDRNCLESAIRTTVALVRLGYHVLDFADCGEYVWEVRLECNGREVAMYWVHPVTEDVRRITGA